MDARRSDSFVLAPLLLVAALAAHAIAYVVAVPKGPSRAALLAGTGHGYLSWTPEIVGLAGLLLVVGLALRLVAAAAGARSRSVHPAAALVPLAGFVVQETLERLVSGGISPALATERPFLVGVVLQLLFGALALGASRLLVRSVERLGDRLAPRARFRRPWSTPAPRPAHDLLRPSPLAFSSAGRAPPSLVS